MFTDGSWIQVLLLWPPLLELHWRSLKKNLKKSVCRITVTAASHKPKSHFSALLVKKSCMNTIPGNKVIGSQWLKLYINREGDIMMVNEAIYWHPFREGDMKVDDWTGLWSVGRGGRFTNAQGGEEAEMVWPWYLILIRFGYVLNERISQRVWRTFWDIYIYIYQILIWRPKFL